MCRLLGQARNHFAIGNFGGSRDEGRDVADQVAAQSEHVERERKVALLVLIPAVEGERDLSVGTNLDLTPTPRARERPASQEDGDLVATAEPGLQGRHR